MVSPTLLRRGYIFSPIHIVCCQRIKNLVINELIGIITIIDEHVDGRIFCLYFFQKVCYNKDVFLQVCSTTNPKGGERVKELKNKVQELVNRYEEQLALHGVKIVVSKRYFETETEERMGGTGGMHSIFNPISRAMDEKRERKRGYRNVRNRYHCMVLTVLPIDPSHAPKNDCKDYAFLLSKVERAHIGEEPVQTDREERRVLSKIQKRILKILKKAEHQNPQRLCKNHLTDAFRYSMSNRYGYKKEYLGKADYDWEFIVNMILIGVVAGGMVLAGIVLYLLFGRT